MHCSSCEPLLGRYLEGTLPSRKLVSISHHLERCASCSKLFDELRAIDGLLATARRAELPPNFTFSVMAGVGSLPAPRVRVRQFWKPVVIYLGVAWVAIAIVALLADGGSLRGLAYRVAAAFGHASSALAGAAHAVGPAAPIVISSVGALLSLDLVLIVAVFFFYRIYRKVPLSV